MTGQDAHPAGAGEEYLEGLELAIVVGERYQVGRRQHTLTPRLALATARARSALIEAARERDVLTYGELSEAIGGLVLPRHMGPLLHMLAHDCAARGEPGLAALVVSAATGEVGTPDAGWAPPQRQTVWAHWAG
ncbi:MULTISPECIES: hypothetical protein [Actinomyces]|uniref:Uncharacterized protein n=1 Tax=Actinomyces respiraculi TaxID=2744574 RepID=A0A7T0LMQ3_9ACTO|nr:MULTISPECIES: hypothetical protein [Actinomyces]QPL06281.1 hypothetical protein ID810_05110 [Actinomyces respiraculi]